MSVFTKLFLIFVLFPLLTSGHFSIAVQQNNSEESIRELTNTLYDQFLSSSSASPAEVLNSDGYYVLDFKSHQRKLKSLSFFTGSFIENEKAKFAECAQMLDNTKIRPADVEEDIAYAAPVACSFFSYIYYFQAQESPTYYKLEKLSVKGKSATAEMHYYDNPKNSWDNLIYLKLEYTLTHDGWKVDSITKIK